MNREKNVFLVCSNNLKDVESILAKYTSISTNYKFNSKKTMGNYYLYKFFKKPKDYFADIESKQCYVLNYIKRDKKIYKNNLERYWSVINQGNSKENQKQQIVDKIFCEMINMSNPRIVKEIIELGDFSGVYYDNKKNRLICCKLGTNRNLKLFIAKKDDEVIVSNNQKLLLEIFPMCEVVEIDKNVIFTVANNNVEFYKLEDIINRRELPNISKNQKDNSENIEIGYKPKHLSSSIGYGVYLTDQKYNVNPALGRDKEIRKLIKSLVVPKKGVILVGSPGVGKTEIIRGLSYLIQQGEICEYLKNKSIYSVKVSSLLSDTKYRGSFEQKIEELCNNLIKMKDVILFIDEIHTSIKAGSCEENSTDLTDILSPYISENLIKVIGCTTKEGFNEICLNQSFYRRFNVVEVEELEIDVVRNILKRTINNNDFDIKVCLTEDELNIILNLIIKYSKRKQKYINQVMCNPDSSLNILMNCFAYFVISNIKCAKYNDFLDGLIDNDNLYLSSYEIYEIETLKDVSSILTEEKKEKTLRLCK